MDLPAIFLDYCREHHHASSMSAYVNEAKTQARTKHNKSTTIFNSKKTRLSKPMQSLNILKNKTKTETHAW
jgi:hypothetical protein